VTPHKPDEIGELATELDDLADTVEELQADPPAGVNPEHLDALKDALDEASDATDDIVNERDGDANDS
jgi:hypothetical protein